MVKRARSRRKFWEYTTDILDENGRRKQGRQYGSLGRTEPMARWFKNLWYLNGELVRKLREDRSNATVRLWVYDRKMEIDVPRNVFIKYRKQAFTSIEVAYLLRLSPSNFYTKWNKAVAAGIVSKPKGMDKVGLYHTGSPLPKLYNEEDVFRIRDWLSKIKSSERTDGGPTNLVPTETEINAMIGKGMVLYTEDLEGNKIPVWREASY